MNNPKRKGNFVTRRTPSAVRPRVCRRRAAWRLTVALVAGLVLVPAVGPAHAQSDTTPPTVESAWVEGTALTLIFSETLKATSTAGMQWAWTVDGIIDGASVSPTGMSIDDETVTLTLSVAATADQTVTVDYYADALTERLQDHRGQPGGQLQRRAGAARGAPGGGGFAGGGARVAA